MTQELAVENNLAVDASGFNEAFKAHQDLSRSGAEQKFKGGLADQGEMSVNITPPRIFASRPCARYSANMWNSGGATLLPNACVLIFHIRRN